MHKSVVAAEKMLVKIMERAQWLYQHAKEGIATGSSLDHFLEPFSGKIEDIDLAAYCQLDDIDILSAIKKWQHHSDKVLSILCTRILNRKCYKCKMQSEPINENDWNKASAQVKATFNLSDEELPFLCFKGEASNTLYKQGDETIKILLKNGELSTISDIDNALINESLSAPVKKFYICLLNE